jgi:hypothetical protein
LSAWGAMSGMGAFAPQFSGNQQFGAPFGGPQQAPSAPYGGQQQAPSAPYGGQQQAPSAPFDAQYEWTHSKSMTEGTTNIFSCRMTSGMQSQFGSPASSPAAGGYGQMSDDSCFNIIDSDFPYFSSYCSALPQTTFSLPNFFGHQTKQQAHDSLATITPALDSGCLKEIRLFACPLYFPPCGSAPILPCARFCRGNRIHTFDDPSKTLPYFSFCSIDVQSRCSGLGLSVINCDQLPEQSEFCPSETWLHSLGNLIDLCIFPPLKTIGIPPSDNTYNRNSDYSSRSQASSYIPSYMTNGDSSFRTSTYSNTDGYSGKNKNAGGYQKDGMSYGGSNGYDFFC